MQMSDGTVSGALVLGIAGLFFTSITICLKTSYKKKQDSMNCSFGWGFVTYGSTRDVKVEEDIELGKKRNRVLFGGGSTETNSEFNSDFNIESKRDI